MTAALWNSLVRKKKEEVMRMSRKSRASDLQVVRRMNSKSGKQERAPPPGPDVAAHARERHGALPSVGILCAQLLLSARRPFGS